MPPRLHTDRTSGKQNSFSRKIGLKRQEMSQLRLIELLTELVEFPYSDPAGTGFHSLSDSIYGIFPIAKCVLTDRLSFIVYCLLSLLHAFPARKQELRWAKVSTHLREFQRPLVLLSIPPVFLFKQLTFRAFLKDSNRSNTSQLSIRSIVGSLIKRGDRLLGGDPFPIAFLIGLSNWYRPQGLKRKDSCIASIALNTFVK